VIVAIREEVVVLAVAETVIVALPEPRDGDTVSHVALPLSTVQLMLEVITKVAVSLADEKLNVLLETVRNANIPSCDTFIVRNIPPPLMVIVAVREEVDVLAWVVTVIVALPELAVVDKVSQEASPLLTVQLVLEVIVNGRGSPEDEKFNEDGETSKTGVIPTCVTFTIRFIPPALMMIVAVREEVDVLAAAVTVIVLLLEPEDEDRVSHVAVPLLTVQLALEVMFIARCSTEDEKSNEEGDTDRTAPSCVTVTVRDDTPGIALLTVIVPVR
jgi:hypothetical protein